MKLTDNDLDKVCERLAAGERLRDLAAEFKISYEQLSRRIKLKKERADKSLVHRLEVLESKMDSILALLRERP